MAIEVKVPSIGESVTTGILAAWHVAEGDYVTQDQHLYDLETDKITSEGLAEAEGKISLKVTEGSEVEIGHILAVIDETATKSTSAEQLPPASKPPEPAAPRPEEAAQPREDKLIPLSPAVRRLAAEIGIDPTEVVGSGKQGRVTKGDMLVAAEEQQQASQPVAKALSPEKRTTRQKITPIRKRIAERLVQAQQTAASLTTFNEVDLSRVIALRQTQQESFQKAHGIKLGFMSFFIKAVVYALQKVPQLNTQIQGDYRVQNHFYDISVALSAPQGLIVPVIRDCARLTFAAIEQSLKDYADKARDNKITLDDLSGGVFTISNGGVFGSMLSTPILNPPQSGILGMHSIQDRPVVHDGETVIRPMMYLALSYDHRLVDGREAVSFLIKIKEAIEEPARILLDI